MGEAEVIPGETREAFLARRKEEAKSLGRKFVERMIIAPSLGPPDVVQKLRTFDINGLDPTDRSTCVLEVASVLRGGAVDWDDAGDEMYELFGWMPDVAQLESFLEGAGAKPRSIAPAALPQVKTATVKAVQGSKNEDRYKQHFEELLATFPKGTDGRMAAAAIGAGALMKLDIAFARMNRLEQRLGELQTNPLVYAGTHEADKCYVKGQFVTFDGSIWYCSEKTTARPGAGESGWTLAVKRGRDGR